MTLIELRKSRNLTQNEVAFALDVSQAAVAQWERMKNQPTKKNVKKLANLFKVDVEVVQRAVQAEQTDTAKDGG